MRICNGKKSQKRTFVCNVELENLFFYMIFDINDCFLYMNKKSIVLILRLSCYILHNQVTLKIYDST